MDWLHMHFSRLYVTPSVRAGRARVRLASIQPVLFVTLLSPEAHSFSLCSFSLSQYLRTIFLLYLQAGTEFVAKWSHALSFA